MEEGEGGGAPRLQGAAGRLEPPLVAEPPPPPAPSMVMAEPRRPPPLLPRGLGPVRVGFYDIEGTLGKGNFAVVKLARHRITRSEVRRDAALGAAVSPCPGLARPRRRGSPAPAGPRSAGRWAAALGSPRGLEVGGGRRPECCGALLRTSEGAGRRGSARKGGYGSSLRGAERALASGLRGSAREPGFSRGVAGWLGGAVQQRPCRLLAPFVPSSAGTSSCRGGEGAFIYSRCSAAGRLWSRSPGGRSCLFSCLHLPGKGSDDVS